MSEISTTPPQLIFRLRHALYAVDALAVREVVPFLALAPIEELPGYVLGVANLRGSVVPVVDLDLRFGRPAQARRRSDCIVVLQREVGEGCEQRAPNDGRSPCAVGIVVNEVQEVRRLPADSLERPPASGQEARDSAFVAALARLDEQVVMLLDVDALLRLSETPVARGLDQDSEMRKRGAVGGESPAPDGRERGAAHLSDALEEQRVFEERARELARPLAGGGSARGEPVAVIRLGSEYLGFELAIVREFTTTRQVTPVPCCPAHIAGQMNLRGDIVTLVDLRPVMKLVATQSEPLSGVVLLELGELRFGVLVDEVLEIVSLAGLDSGAGALTPPAGLGDTLKHAAPYRGRMVGIVDLPRIVAEGNLVVNASET
jgi:purine-binding chemotaxis protein CheW